MTVSLLTELLNKYCIMEQVESVVISDDLMIVSSSRVVDVNKNSVQRINRMFKYNEVYSQWEWVFTDCSDISKE